MPFKTLEFTIENSIATIKFNRPDNANAMTPLMGSELLEAAIQCESDQSVRAVVITGNGKMFSAGGDLQSFEDAGDQKYGFLIRMATDLHQALIRFSHLDAPVIMAVNGTAAGAGFSISLAGDYVIASEKAKFVCAYTASGLTPDGSSTYFLAKHVGLMRAKELMLTNRVLSAEEACHWGMVSRVVDADSVMQEAVDMAKQFVVGPTMAFGGVKSMLLTTFNSPIEAQLEKETQSIANMMRTEDGPAGLSAFLAKQKPEFKGH